MQPPGPSGASASALDGVHLHEVRRSPVRDRSAAHEDNDIAGTDKPLLEKVRLSPIDHGVDPAADTLDGGTWTIKGLTGLSISAGDRRR